MISIGFISNKESAEGKEEGSKENLNKYLVDGGYKNSAPKVTPNLLNSQNHKGDVGVP